MRKKILFILFILLISFVASESFYSTTISNLDATVKMHGFGEIKELATGEVVELTVLTYQESEFQKVKVVSEKLYINDSIIFPTYILDEFGNKYAKFSINQNGKFDYELIADIQTQSIIHNLTDYDINGYPEEFEIYLHGTEKIESDSSEIKTVAFNKFRSDKFVETLNETIFWVNDYVEYAKDTDFQKYYLLQQSAINTLLEKKGVCDEFANLAAAILRAKGIPTRVAVGITFDGLNWGNHAWIEVYHKEYGWLASDPTFREAGFVDATHIKIGAFKDVSLSVAKAVYPKNAKITFQTQTLPEVNIKNKKFFSHAQLTTNNKELIANKWNEIKINIKNKTSGILTAPIIARQNYSQILIQEDTKSVILQSGEEKEVVFRIYPKIDLKNNQIAKGQIIFNSLAEPLEIEFEIKPGPVVENGTVYVRDVTPITTKELLILEITLINELSEVQTVKIDLNNSNNNYSWVSEIGPFERKNVRQEIDLVKEKQYLEIETISQIYQKEIVPIKNGNIEIIEIRENVIVQEIPNTKREGITTTLISRPEIFLFALLIGIAVLLLGLFAVKKRYV